MILEIVILAVITSPFLATAGTIYVGVSGRAWRHVRWLMPVGSFVLGLSFYVYSSEMEHVQPWHVVVSGTLAVWLAIHFRPRQRARKASVGSVLGFAVMKSTFVLTLMVLMTDSALRAGNHL